MITATARSTTLPRAMKSRNSWATRTGASAALASMVLVSVTQISRKRAYLGRAKLVAVQAYAQLLARLEERHRLGAHLHRLAGAGVAARPRRARAHREGAETAQLHAAALLQRLDHLLEDDTDDALDVLLGEVRILARQSRDQLGLDHPAPLVVPDEPLPNQGAGFKGLSSPAGRGGPRKRWRGDVAARIASEPGASPESPRERRTPSVSPSGRHLPLTGGWLLLGRLFAKRGAQDVTQ